MQTINNNSTPPGEENIEARLWEYIDGTASLSEKTVIEKLLAEDATWKSKYKELLRVQELLQSSELDQPSLRFTRNVMEEISRLHIAPAARSYINKKIVWGIGFFFIAMFVGIVIYGIGQMSFTSGEESTISKNLNKIDFSKFFSNTWVNALMMVNVVIGLFLLDNYLNSKRKQFKKT
jgi:hypothetical protein